MLRAMLSSWDKKGERYSFVNVPVHLQKDLISVLPPGTNIRHRADINSAESEEARVEEAAGLLTASGKDATLLDV